MRRATDAPILFSLIAGNNAFFIWRIRRVISALSTITSFRRYSLSVVHTIVHDDCSAVGRGHADISPRWRVSHLKTLPPRGEKSANLPPTAGQSSCIVCTTLRLCTLRRPVIVESRALMYSHMQPSHIRSRASATPRAIAEHLLTERALSSYLSCTTIVCYYCCCCHYNYYY